MKKIFLSVVVASVITTGLYAQATTNSTTPTPQKSLTHKQISPNREKKIVAAADVPDAVKQSFASSFPSVKDNSAWKKNEKGLYETHFPDGGNAKFLKYDASGKLLQTKESVAVSSLPSSVSEYINKNYPGESITQAFNITNNESNKTFLRVKTSSKLLNFGTDGKFMYEEGQGKLPRHENQK